MALYSSLASLSQTAASNAADGSVDAPSTIDQQTNLLASFVAQLRDGIGFTGQLGTKNRIRNGNFAINQRVKTGTVTLAAGVYGHDGWKAGALGCTYTFATSGLDTTVTISAGSLVQTIEAADVEGGNYVMSWTGTSTGKIGGGAFSASGVTATGVTASANLTVEFSTGTVGLVQLEPGANASVFERRSYLVELARCQRFYETGSAWFNGYAGAGGIPFAYAIPFKVPKASGTPTLTYATGTAVNVSVFDARNPSFDCLRWYCTSTGAGAVQWDGAWTASSEL